jgi:tetratricopeptide (TPR) repeat protein
VVLVDGQRIFDRKQLLSEAQRARARGRIKRAIGLYQYTLASEPDSVEIATRLAPLLAFDGRSFEAWRHFRNAGRALLRQGRREWALAIFRDATRCLPQEFEAWRISAELERKLGRRELAFETLLEGRNQFRLALQRDQAIALLELAREVEPWDVDVVVDLSQLLARTGQVTRALDLLEELALHSEADDKRRVRTAQWRITWSPHHAWLALSAIGARFRRSDSTRCESGPSTAVGFLSGR